MKKVKIASWSDLEPEKPAYALVSNVDLVVIRWKEEEQKGYKDSINRRS